MSSGMDTTRQHAYNAHSEVGVTVVEDCLCFKHSFGRRRGPVDVRGLTYAVLDNSLASGFSYSMTFC